MAPVGWSRAARAAVVGRAVVVLVVAIAAPVLACTVSSTITIENHQARDLRVHLPGNGEYVGVAEACAVSMISTYIPVIVDPERKTRRNVRVQFLE